MLRLSRFTFGICFLLIFLQSLFAQVSTNPSTGPNLEVILNRVTTLGETGIKIRDIYIFLSEEGFSGIPALLDKIQNENCDPYVLKIVVYSDRKMLEKLITFDAYPTTVHFKTDEQGQKAESEYYAKVYPNPSGYLRAEYYRNANYELFDYDLDKEVGGMKRVYIRNQDAPITGEANLKLPASKCKRT